MSWWSRLWRPQAESEPPTEFNLLVISDIHLGEDVLTSGPEHLSAYIRAPTVNLGPGSTSASWPLVAFSISMAGVGIAP